MSKDTAILIFRVLSGVATVCMVSSPALLINRIHKQKHVGVASIFPLAALLANLHIWMMYGYLEDMWFPVFSCFLYGECCAVVFLTLYTYYCSDKGYVVRTLAVFLAVLGLITLYAIVGGLGYTGQTTASVSTVLGIFADCAGISLYGAPMELFQVLKHKSAVCINVHMVYAGIVNNIVWLAYGVLITNWFIIFINVLFIAVNTFTMCLYVKYDRKTHPLQDGSDARSDDEQVSVTIEMAAHLETKASKKVLTSLPSPEYSCLSSPLEDASRE
ncbi:hypothetical protein PHYPSEUDO_002526 [Phytophthora pseudosyringae]|uniref:MtN3-like protein n=1 Tax=Phytophthora pseudosyringae TaxID=221518 RepID=A0A8T1VWB2_9STRA|nr:hypothetical protein PHYPSEUDO_002526 [Phytophthora pseudosyringae]